MTNLLEKRIFQIISGILKQDLPEASEDKTKFKLERIANPIFGDFSSNIVMVLKLNNDIVSKIVKQLELDQEIKKYIDKIEFKQPGFLNFYVKAEFLVDNLQRMIKLNKKDFFVKNPQSFLIEHTSPNTNKALHIGHLRNTVLAMAIIRILKALNHKVVSDCLFNDRGIHICKAMLGYLRFEDQQTGIEAIIHKWNTKSQEWPKPLASEAKDAFIGKYYVWGVKLEKEERYQEELQWLLKAWESNNPLVRKLWKQMNGWFYNEFAKTFKIINSQVDHFWYESQFYQKAKDLLKQNINKNVFKTLEDGAILTQLQSYGLTDTIVQRSDGTAMYFTQDLYLTKMKTQKFNCNWYIWIVGPEQKLHMQQIFAVCDQLKIGNINKFKHLSYGAVCNKDGSKMSSRSGEVLSIMELLQEINSHIHLKMNNDYKSLKDFNKVDQERIINQIALGSIKYAMLKLEREQDLKFDINEATDLKGNGSPYIQYTYARCQSILNKVKQYNKLENIQTGLITNEEKILLRQMLYFKDILIKAGENFTPHILAIYLFELAQNFSSFYEKNRIIDANTNQKLKIDLTKGVANILKWGLELLGIEVMVKL